MSPDDHYDFKTGAIHLEGTRFNSCKTLKCFEIRL